jgi:hypothetical protein
LALAGGAASADFTGAFAGGAVVAQPLTATAATSATVHVHKRMEFCPIPETRADDRPMPDPA